MTETAASPLPVLRPRTRGDCVNGPRPCPWVACRHHLWLDVDRRGFIQAGSRGTDIACLTTMPETCALDVADAGGTTVDHIALLYGVSTSRIGQLIQAGLRRLARLAHPCEDDLVVPPPAARRP